MNVSVRRSIVVAAALLAAPVVSSCGTNFGIQTDQPYNPSVGVDNRTGEVYVINTLVTSGTPGSGTVVAGLVNTNQNRADKLVGVSGVGKDSNLQFSISGPRTIPAGGLLNLATAGGVSVKGSQVKPGFYVTLKFSFAHAQAITINAPVEDHGREFAKIPLPGDKSTAPSSTQSQKPVTPNSQKVNKQATKQGTKNS